MQSAQGTNEGGKLTQGSIPYQIHRLAGQSTEGILPDCMIRSDNELIALCLCPFLALARFFRAVPVASVAEAMRTEIDLAVRDDQIEGPTPPLES
jgi:hypothetical protein